MSAILEVQPAEKSAQMNGTGAGIYKGVVNQSHLELIITVSLLLMLVYPGDLWYEAIFIRIIAVWAFIDRSMARHPLFWLIVALMNLFIQNLYNWAFSDNHKWLITYWYLALACSLWHSEPARVMELNGRWLIGLTFLFAVAKKLISSEYLSGNTFHQMLYFDSRFGDIARMTADLKMDHKETAKQLLSLQNSIGLPPAPNLVAVAQFLTWWTVLIEIAIAVFFLLPPSSRITRWKDVALMIFIITVYPIAPVLGFAWILIILGIAQCNPLSGKTLFGYLLLFPTIRVFEGGMIRSLIVNWLLESRQ